MAKLPCSIFLEKQFVSGGVSRQGYEALRSTIGMITEMGWETRVIWQGKMVFGKSRELFEGHVARIVRVCGVFSENMRRQLRIIDTTTNMLPDLKDLEGDDLEDALTTWCNKLRVIHEPDENDNKLFRLLFIHYDTAVHQRLVTLHQYKPKYGVGSLVDCGVKLRSALRELIQMTQAADRRVRDLKAAHDHSKQVLEEMRTAQEDWEQAVVSPEQSPPDLNKQLPPLPGTLLKRCRTFRTHETEVQDRMVRGQMIRSRRPSRRGRAATIEEQGMEAWWRQGTNAPLRPPPRSPWKAGAGPSRKNTF